MSTRGRRGRELALRGQPAGHRRRRAGQDRRGLGGARPARRVLGEERHAQIGKRRRRAQLPRRRRAGREGAPGEALVEDRAHRGEVRGGDGVCRGRLPADEPHRPVVADDDLVGRQRAVRLATPMDLVELVACPGDHVDEARRQNGGVVEELAQRAP